jgi:alpha-methylacyl-CoA racemase
MSPAYPACQLLDNWHILDYVTGHLNGTQTCSAPVAQREDRGHRMHVARRHDGSGPLRGVRVVELAGQGPGPFACMLLADLGAEVVRIERVGRAPGPAQRRLDVHARGRRSIAVDLKDPRGVELVLDLVGGADVVVEGYRPGVVERLGLGPDLCLARNPRLVYGRMTGWGQDGPLAARAGHDINYLALTGALHAIGPADGAPAVPLNLVADYGGGGAFLALGVTAAVLEARTSGHGQVVDAAMIDGVAAMAAPFYAMVATGAWHDRRGANILDSGAHFYGVYRTADERWVAVGAIEPAFYEALLALLGLDPSDLPAQFDRRAWAEVRARLADIFATRDRDAWVAHFADHDACLTPVLSLGEAPLHPHARARAMFEDVDGVPQPRPAPRFSRTALAGARPVEPVGASTDELLRRLGRSDDEIATLRTAGVVG